MTKAEQLIADPDGDYDWVEQATTELCRLAPMEKQRDEYKEAFEGLLSHNEKVVAILRISQARVKELEDAFSQIKHSITQAKIVGNDWRRELDLINNITNLALGETK